MEFTILNWNIGGAKYLEEKRDKREATREQLNFELRQLISWYGRPQVVTLQEIVRYREPGEDMKDLIDPIPGYRYHPFPLIDSDRLSSKAKWNKVKENGGWDEGTFFAQGNAMLFRDDLPHFPVWDLSRSSKDVPTVERHYVEQVNLESGLYFGDRNTEPRAVLVAHFILESPGRKGKPLDIFVINLHLTTLMMEREGIPEIDLTASRIRLRQLDVIFQGIISRYNMWKRQGFPERGKRRRPAKFQTFTRHEPVWILAGDFNFTPASVEYESIMKMNFLDVVLKKGSGTKSSGPGNPPTLTLDYVLAGPNFLAFNPVITGVETLNNCVDIRTKGSDHYPLYAKIPLTLPWR